jgi:hypothetical protein
MFVLWRFGPVRLYRGKREPAGALRRWSPRNVIFTAAETLFSTHRSFRTQPGTDGSNPSLSSGESANHRFLIGGVSGELCSDRTPPAPPALLLLAWWRLRVPAARCADPAGSAQRFLNVYATVHLQRHLIS